MKFDIWDLGFILAFALVTFTLAGVALGRHIFPRTQTVKEVQFVKNDLDLNIVVAKAKETERQEAVKMGVGAYVLNHETGVIEFRYLNLEEYTNSLVRQLMPQLHGNQMMKVPQ